MDNFETIRFAIDNLGSSEHRGEAAKAAFERILEGEAIVDVDPEGGRRYERLSRDTAR